MTAVLIRPDGRLGTMPGWRIVADLTPPELINARHLGTIRRRIVVGLVLVALLCGAGYAYATIQHGSAADAASTASAETAELNHAAAKYAGITRIEATVDSIRGQVATVMHVDVDVAGVLAAIRLALPGSMTIGNLSLTLTPATVAGAGGVVGLDASGHPEIGSVTVTGSGRTLDDLPAFVDRLVAIKGVVNVLPSSNLVTSGKAQFTLTFELTDQLYSHRYDLSHTGGK